MKDLKDYGGTCVTANIEMDFILKNGETYHLGMKKIDEYLDTYPMLDVVSELKVARQWLIDNPNRRKTSRGMGKFINTWLNNARHSAMQKINRRNQSGGFMSIDF